MTTSTKIDYTSGQFMTEHFKALVNFLNNQTKQHADKVFARYLSKDKSYKTLTYAQVDHLATNLACKWEKFARTTEVIAYVSEHTISYLIVMMALLKLRRTMMAISPRNSEAAIVNLLEKTQSKFIIADSKYGDITQKAIDQIGGIELVVIQPLDIEDLLDEPLNPDHEHLLSIEFSDDDINKDALIIHSSGTTSFPKPIYLSNRYLIHLLISIFEFLGPIPLSHKDVMLSCGPLFHIFGVFAHFSISIFGGSVVFMEKLPASQSDINFALKSNNVTIMCAPPLIFEQMIPFLKESNDFSAIRRLKLVLYGGAALKQESGEWLRKKGMNICSGYGTTETGCSMVSDASSQGNTWSSLRIYQKNAQGDYCGVFETCDPSEPDVKHLYFRCDSPNLASNVGNRPDGGYSTNDLFKENPEAPGYYIYLGRRDDTLIMENGEKTNPVPMEAAIRQSPFVYQAAVLGQGRQCTAALVEINTEYALNFSPDAIIAGIHEVVKQANVECPSHSKVLPQMIKILPFNKSLPSTDKGTVKRKLAEQIYKDEVEKLYKDFLEGPSPNTDKSNVDTSTWTPEQTEDFLITSAAKVLGMEKTQFSDPTQSLFDLGLNSLTSIQLRNEIAQYFENVPQNFLFQHPSVISMREALLGDETEDISEQSERRYQQTQDLAMAYTKKAKHDFPIARNEYDEKKEKVVLLTGVTGSLGAFMLHDLLKDSSVKKVYCCVRGKQEQLEQRLLDAFRSRLLDTSLLNTDRVEVLPMKFNEPFLGFGQELYNQLRNEVTIVQHCAWLLDFNMPVDHYDKECIAPFYNLLKFAYHEINPMHVHFISSVSASAAVGDQVNEEPLPLDAHVCMPMGYAHSKFVVEKLFDYLTTEKNFPCYVERLGQVCGDSKHGVWNTSEQYPLMFIGGGAMMKKMPKLETDIDWISVDYAATTITDIMLRTAYAPAQKNQHIYHIVNPRLITWSHVLDAMKASGMQFDIVEPKEWIELLAKDQSNPCYRLMSFYEASFKNPFKMPVWKTEKTSSLAPVINDSPVLDASLFTKFLSHWQSVGFYRPS
ncbi:uncharacterized protein B0P05DRAFT_484698 [Gilbertella persicaria]|uniref:Carrier domain-containing protein n=1 Tax=Rhizopus stolonifer TaxID=4846 RepID=A0A367KF47_RHIST|nr:uncharacterized protein B0P05DRAFT_484698 [Gilbertella persicaria]KAI8091211.1 hypothetical protein B0P05DRAFT_484698 [Gilbertella persicaria]RCI00798.1 hypothetical protein CU098_007922 [Rhizopus stolonifer]